MFRFDLITVNTTCNTNVNKKANIGSPWRVPLSNVKYFVVIHPLIILDF